MKFRLSVIGFFFVVAVLAVQLCAQLTGDTVTVPSFLKKEKNVIEFNDADWSALFDGMVRLQNDTDTVPRVVAMVHIGDSHVQAGFLTEAVRLPLQRRFGDAGRGLVVPLKLAKTNEPRDYSVVADGSWNFSRCVGRKYSNYTPGVGGIAIVPRNGRIDLTVSTLSKTDDCAGFKKVRLFHAPVDSFPGVISEPFLVEGETRLPFLTHFSCAEELERILNHLLNNAAEYTKSGKISLEFKKRSAHTHQFILTDTGTGIPVEAREKLFKPFAEIRDLTQGNGLGLPTCSLIAYKLNGTLTLDTDYKKGTRFILELHV